MDLWLFKEATRHPRGELVWPSGKALSPFLTGECFSPNILRTLRRTMIRFLIELLVRQIWFRQSRLYFILNWLVMRCKLRPELGRQTRRRQHDRKCRLKSSQVKSVYFHHPSQGISTNYYLILGLRDKARFAKKHCNTSVRYRFGSPFSSEKLWFVDIVLWLCPSLPTETLKWLSSLPILM